MNKKIILSLLLASCLFSFSSEVKAQYKASVPDSIWSTELSDEKINKLHRWVLPYRENDRTLTNWVADTIMLIAEDYSWDRGKAISLSLKGQLAYYVDPDSSITIYRMALEQLQPDKDTLFWLDINARIAHSQIVLRELSAAKQTYLDILKNKYSRHRPYLRATTNYSLYRVLAQLGALDSAQQCLITGIDILEKDTTVSKQQSDPMIGNMKQGLANIYRQNNLEPEALVLYREAMARNPSIEMQTVANLNIGITHARLERLDSADYYFNKSLSLDQRPQSRINTFAMLGELSIKREKYREALDHLDEADRLAIETGIKSFSSNIQRARAVAYERNGDYLKAIKQYNLVRQDAEREENYSWIRTSLSGITRNNLKLRAPDLVATFDSIDIAYDTLTARAVFEKINATKVEMDTENKIRENILLKREKEVETIRANTNYKVGIAMAVFSLLLGILLFFLNRQKKELKLVNTKMNAQNIRIQALNADLDHRTSNYLGSIRFLLERQRDSADDAGLDVTVVNSLDRQILAFTKVQDKLKETLDDVNLKEYLEDFCEAVREALAAQGRPVQFNVNVADVDVKPSFAAPLALIINELATNSMKYARREDGLLRIALDAVEVNGGELRVFYRDGGAQDGEIDPRVFSSGQGVETILGFTDQLKGRVVRYGEESYDYEVVFGLEG